MDSSNDAFIIPAPGADDRKWTALELMSKGKVSDADVRSYAWGEGIVCTHEYPGNLRVARTYNFSDCANAGHNNGECVHYRTFSARLPTRVLSTIGKWFWNYENPAGKWNDGGKSLANFLNFANTYAAPGKTMSQRVMLVRQGYNAAKPLPELRQSFEMLVGAGFCKITGNHAVPADVITAPAVPFGMFFNVSKRENIKEIRDSLNMFGVNAGEKDMPQDASTPFPDSVAPVDIEGLSERLPASGMEDDNSTEGALTPATDVFEESIPSMRCMPGSTDTLRAYYVLTPIDPANSNAGALTQKNFPYAIDAHAARMLSPLYGLVIPGNPYAYIAYNLTCWMHMGLYGRNGRTKSEFDMEHFMNSGDIFTDDSQKEEIYGLLESVYVGQAQENHEKREKDFRLAWRRCSEYFASYDPISALTEDVD